MDSKTFCLAARAIAPIGLLLTLVACGDAHPPPDPPPMENMPMTKPPPDQADTGPAERLAVIDLAQRLAIETDRVQVVSARAVTWSDGALGCPQPDGMYTQALVEGFQIVLAAQGDEYHYHAGPDGEPFLCPEERRQTPVGAGRTRY